MTEEAEHRQWRVEFSSWPESTLRMFSEQVPGLAFDVKRSFARAVLAEMESAKRDAREAKTLRLASEANSIARSASRKALWANIIAATAATIAIASAIAEIMRVVIESKP